MWLNCPLTSQRRWLSKKALWKKCPGDINVLTASVEYLLWIKEFGLKACYQHLLLTLVNDWMQCLSIWNAKGMKMPTGTIACWHIQALWLQFSVPACSFLLFHSFFLGQPCQTFLSHLFEQFSDCPSTKLQLKASAKTRTGMPWSLPVPRCTQLHSWSPRTGSEAMLPVPNHEEVMSYIANKFLEQLVPMM